MSNVDRIQPIRQAVDPRELKPNVRLFGGVDEAMLAKVLDAIDAVMSGSDPLVLELTTMGGDADIGRRIALECRLVRDTGRPLFFLGKSSVFSAGVTIMASFPAASRYLDRNGVLLIHERRLDKQVHYSGPLRSNIQMANELIAQLQSGLEADGFRELVDGTKISLEELSNKAAETNWYVRAEEALKLGLVAGIF